MSSSPHFADKAPPIPGPGEVLTLEDVAKADFSGVTPLGVLGFPIRHSVSPQMHNAALAVLAKSDPKFASWRYYRIEVPPERLKEALDLLAKKGFVGLNLTIPHKVEVIDFLAKKSSRVEAAGAANTLLRTNAGWEGENTDGSGFYEAVMTLFQFTSCATEPADVVLLGAGGAARAVAETLLLLNCRLWIGNRTKSHLDTLMMFLTAGRSLREATGFDLANPPGDLPKAPLVVNVTSLGLKPDDPSPIDLSIFGPGTRVFDTTYGRHKSALVKQAEELGFPASNGLPMLVHQGVGALHYWTHFPESLLDDVLAAMFAAAYEATGVPDPRKRA